MVARLAERTSRIAFLAFDSGRSAKDAVDGSPSSSGNIAGLSWKETRNIAPETSRECSFGNRDY